MKTMKESIKISPLKNLNEVLDKEYNEALKNPVFEEIVT